MASAAGALPGCEGQILHLADADAAEDGNALGLHEGVVRGRLLLELAEAGLARAGRLVPVGLLFLMRHGSPRLMPCSDIQNTVPVFCKARSFDHIIPASVNRRRRAKSATGSQGRVEGGRRWKGSIVLLQVLCVGLAGAQSPEKNQAVYLYEGSDRAQRLAERARQEGALMVYTSLATSESVPLTRAFEKKYGVKVELWRSLSDQVVRRALNEAKARRHVVDVIETNAPELEALARERVLARFSSPHIADIPQWGVPAHRMWIADRVDFFVVAFNTARVRREELPATYEGFLDPKWKGRIGLEATDQEWLAGLAKQ